MYNQYDLSQIYGVPISNPSNASPGGTLQNTLTDNIPSLQEIASVNQSLQEPIGVIDVPQILNSNHTTQSNANISASNSGLNLRPAPQRQNTIPIYQDVVQSGMIATPAGAMGAEQNDSIEYLNGLIRTQIGRRASIDFLLGASGMVTKDGYILGVGSNYILINEVDTDDITACDFYNIKFIKFFY